MGKVWVSGGKVVTDAQGRLLLCDECPCGGGLAILFWKTNVEGSSTPTTLVQAYYSGLGIVTHTNTDWTGNLDDYSLIVWPRPGSDPIWWPRITGGTWSGRIHWMGEFFPSGTGSRTYMNSKTALHGMTVAADSSGVFGCSPGEHSPASAHPLTAGVTDLWHVGTCSVSGGNTLFTNPTLGLPMAQQNKPVGSIVDWVIVGDTNHLSSSCPAMVTYNATFLYNLWDVP